jgi:TonB family protein
MHRAPVLYPESARKQGISGTVVVQAAVDASGDVTDAQVLSGPQELRKAALQSVLQWHFEADAGARSHQVSISFQASAAPAATAAPAVPPPPTLAGMVVRGILIMGVTDQARAQLLAQLPVHLGDTLGEGDASRIISAVANFDQHLGVSFPNDPQSPRAVSIAIAPQGEQSVRIRVGGNVQSTKIISKPAPVYPALAKSAHIQGVVKLHTFIAADGTVQNINVIEGHPLLVPAALEAVKQWVYQPTLLNGAPVAVETEVDVNFTLAQ